MLRRCERRPKWRFVNGWWRRYLPKLGQGLRGAAIVIEIKFIAVFMVQVVEWFPAIRIIVTLCHLRASIDYCVEYFYAVGDQITLLMSDVAH